MNNLFSYLQNLRPNGNSELPKSKLEDTGLDSETIDENDGDEKPNPEPSQSQSNDAAKKDDSNVVDSAPIVKKRGSLIKQEDIRQDSEFEEVVIPVEVPAKQDPAKKQDMPKIEVSPVLVHAPPQEVTNQPEPASGFNINEMNDHEKVKKVWKDLGIGNDGYLTADDLEKFCFHIGMNQLDKEDLERLFKTIDTDNDGRVSFTEFYNGLKHQNKFIEPNSNDESVKPRIARKVPPSQNEPIINRREPSTKKKGKKDPGYGYYTYFSTLNPNKDRFTNPQRIIDLWAAGGIINGKEVLEFLDFDLRKPIDLFELSSVVDDEIDNGEFDAVTLVILVSFKKEIEFQRLMLDTAQDIYNSNAAPKSVKKREADPVYLQEVQSQMVSKNNLTKAELNKQTYQYENIVHNLQDGKTQLVEEVDRLNMELEQTEEENVQLRAKIVELEEISVRQEEELDAVAELHRKMELELKILRETKIAFHQTLSQKDREQLEDLKSKFEEEIDKANKANLTTKQHLGSKIQMEQEAEIMTLRNKLTRVEDEFLAKSKENMELKRISEKLTATMDSQMKLHNAANQSENDLAQKLQDLVRENQILITENTNLKECIDKYEFDVKEVSNEKELLQDRLKATERKLDVVQNREEAVENKLRQTENHFTKNQNLETNISSLKSLLDEKNIQLERSHGKYQEAKLELDDRQSKCERLQKKTDDLARELDKLNNINTKLEMELANSKTQIMTQKYREEPHPIKNDDSDLHDEIRSLRTELKSKTIIIDKLEEANDHLSRSLKDSVDKFERAVTSNVDPQSKDIISENIRLTQHNLRQDEEINKLFRRLAQLQSSEWKDENYQIQSLEKKLAAKEKQMRNLEDSFRKYEEGQMRPTEKFRSLKQLDSLQFQYDELNKKYRIQLEQVDKTDTLLQEVYTENTRLLKSLQRSEDLREQSKLRQMALEEKVHTLQSVLDKLAPR